MQNEFMEVCFNMWPLSDVLMKVVNSGGKFFFIRVI